MRTLVGPAMVMALALTSGCTYVTQGDLEAKKACIDSDGDGAPQQIGDLVCEEDLAEAGLDTLEFDCDESSADRAPHLEEVPYDAIDNDCDANEQDIIDVDGDEYAGISRSDYEALGGVWPEGMSEELDCDDTDDTVHPGSNFEFAYDGIDSDCDSQPDYDFDGDGYIPTLNPNTGLPHDPPYTGLLEDGDCNDNDAAINPGNAAASDLPYDGVDLNCDCVNDFDDDGDGFMWDFETNELAFDTFVAAYGCDLSADQWGDCNDGDLDIFPGADDTWYDGVDSNCDEANDHDQDGDGYEVAGGGDCQDTDPLIFPGALELIGDNSDQDCDGNNDTSAFAFAEASWTNPRSPEVAWSGAHYVLAVGAEQWIDESSVPALTTNWPGLLLSFDTGATNETGFTKNTWNGSTGTDPLGETIDMTVDPDNSRVYVAFSMSRVVGSGSNIYLSLRGFEWSGNNYTTLTPVLKGQASSDFGNDIDVQIAPSGEIVAVSCADTHLQFAQAGWSTGSYARAKTGSVSTAGGQACVMEQWSTTDEENLVHVQDDASWVDDSKATVTDPEPFYVSSASASFDPAPTAGRTYEGVEFGVVNDHLGVLAYADDVSGNSYVVHSNGTEQVFVGVTVHDIKAVEVDGELYIIAVTEDGADNDSLDDLVLLYGTPGSLATVQITVPEGASGLVAPHGASIHVDSERVFLAVAMRDGATVDPVDDVGWMFLGFAP